MIRLLLHYGAEESLKSKVNCDFFMFYSRFLVQPEEVRYQSVCQQLASLTELTSSGSIKKSSSNRLAPDDATVRTRITSQGETNIHKMSQCVVEN